MNSSMMLRHAAAFGLYLVGTSLATVALMFINIFPGNKKAFDFYSAMFIFHLVA